MISVRTVLFIGFLVVGMADDGVKISGGKARGDNLDGAGRTAVPRIHYQYHLTTNGILYSHDDLTMVALDHAVWKFFLKNYNNNDNLHNYYRIEWSKKSTKLKNLSNLFFLMKTGRYTRYPGSSKDLLLGGGGEQFYKNPICSIKVFPIGTWTQRVRSKQRSLKA